MKITIIVDDGFVAVDGEGFNGIDLSELAAENIHAIQFYGTWGEVELKPFMHLDEDGFAKLKKPNNDVFSAEYISVFQREIDRWAMAKEQARIAAEAMAAQAVEKEQARIAAEAMAAQTQQVPTEPVTVE